MLHGSARFLAAAALALSAASAVMATPSPERAAGAPAAAGATVSAGDAGPGRAEREAAALAAAERRRMSSEASAALAETRQALAALDQDRARDARAALDRALGQLERLLLRQPGLALAPTEVNVARYRLVSDAAQARSVRRRAEQLLDQGEVQEARRLLQLFASEIAIHVSHLPLSSYLEAIRAAALRLEAGDRKAARSLLQEALQTLVVIQSVVPLPLAQARDALEAAERLAQPRVLDHDTRARLQGQLAEARRQLELAEAFGYGSRDERRSLAARIACIESEHELAQGLLPRLRLALLQIDPLPAPASAAATVAGR